MLIILPYSELLYIGQCLPFDLRKLPQTVSMEIVKPSAIRLVESQHHSFAYLHYVPSQSPVGFNI